MQTKLKKYLQHNGITSKWLAEKIGTTPTNMSSIANGKSTPTIRLAHEIEKHTRGNVTLYDWVKPEWDK